ncbi:hypothetical protein I3J09_02000 [Streptomyces clavuligerus]|uniref:hypothetical protein n=1 Tax=Streptomyces clavuligerus TaxID=1901 RepID=UPI0008105EDD|nr:hypothetical protein [Streptomyces clavuligerus]ANW17085.1 hypothetical protein BB341_02025 [Streptomyces clavuligerus]AXU11622.1 hypothetical protein D1794_02130 [Streptomyces clavuligerus]MBY6301454.1 hypothetical protein [Streptomyces clavuligerus]QPL61742.1 hypothetical protein I3J04_02000 [Streptomyces clavuligerus]QPL67775.1 hypothetical protein I3J05_02015 [Streptomyces clavuligerus]
MKNSVRNAVLGAALAFLGLELTAVHLLLDLPLTARLLADAVITLVVAGALGALWVPRRSPSHSPGSPGFPASSDRDDPRFDESRCRRRALLHHHDHERRAREGGRLSPPL